MTRNTNHTIDPIRETEDLLRGLIAECGLIIREQLRPALDAEEETFRKSSLVGDAVRLMQTGGSLAQTVTRLREEK
jgi:hypothetical protein